MISRPSLRAADSILTAIARTSASVVASAQAVVLSAEAELGLQYPELSTAYSILAAARTVGLKGVIVKDFEQACDPQSLKESMGDDREFFWNMMHLATVQDVLDTFVRDLASLANQAKRCVRHVLAAVRINGRLQST